jgi:flagellar basal-body rod protein FlgB
MSAIMIDRIDQQLGSLRSAASLRTYRQGLLATNIANADTPNFKARDIDFQQALASVQSGRTPAGSLAVTSPRHLQPLTAEGPYAGALRYRTEYQGAVDGNTVNLDVERAAFAENSVQLEASLTFIRQQLTQLQGAIQGQ